MYNRYIRNDNGSYTRVPQEDAPRQPSSSSGSEQPFRPTFSSPEPEKKPGRTGQRPTEPPPSSPSTGGLGGITDSLTGFLRHILDQLHLEHVDTGDLLLLILLFFLFREDADEELLVSLGLLLIL